MREIVAQVPNQTFSGKSLFFIHFIWWALLLLTIGTIVISIWIDPSYQAALSWDVGNYQKAVATLGWSTTWLDNFYQIMGNLIRLSYIGIGVLIFGRKSHEPIAIYTSIFLITFSVSVIYIGDTAQNHPLISIFANLLQAISQVLLLFYCFIFPDGKFTPRWTRWPTIIATFLYVLARLETVRSSPVLQWIIVFGVLWFFVCIPAQIYRYRYTDAIQRQQIKWGIAGIFGYILLTGGVWLIFGYFLPATLPTLQSQSALALQYTFIRHQVMNIGAASLPIALGIAILRYKLWDIDIIIRRTVQYSILTGLLGLVYFGSVVLLQGILGQTTGERSPLVLVLSTLLIAALFTPLRRRVQNVLDRRFFRQKYDAAQVLAQFATVARDEVEMEKLAAALVHTIETTVQPEAVSVWLKPTPNPRRNSYAE